MQRNLTVKLQHQLFISKYSHFNVCRLSGTEALKPTPSASLPLVRRVKEPSRF